jgi:hypothetical protein
MNKSSPQKALPVTGGDPSFLQRRRKSIIIASILITLVIIGAVIGFIVTRRKDDNLSDPIDPLVRKATDPVEVPTTKQPTSQCPKFNALGEDNTLVNITGRLGVIVAEDQARTDYNYIIFEGETIILGMSQDLVVRRDVPLARVIGSKKGCSITLVQLRLLEITDG